MVRLCVFKNPPVSSSENNVAKNAHVGQNKKFWSRPFSIRFTGGGVRKKTGRRAHQEERNERGVFYHSFCCFFGFRIARHIVSLI